MLTVLNASTDAVIGLASKWIEVILRVHCGPGMRCGTWKSSPLRTKGLFLWQQYNARRELHVLGLAESREGAASVRIKFYLDLKAQAGNELGERRMRLMKEKLVYKSDWWICVLASLSTNFREWTALQSIRSLPFR